MLMLQPSLKMIAVCLQPSLTFSKYSWLLWSQVIYIRKLFWKLINQVLTTEENTLISFKFVALKFAVSSVTGFQLTSRSQRRGVMLNLLVHCLLYEHLNVMISELYFFRILLYVKFKNKGYIFNKTWNFLNIF